MPRNVIPEEDSASRARDRRVLSLYEQVLEIEQRLIPTGLHVFGRVSDERGRADMLRVVASFDRPEAGVRALPDLVAEGLGFPAYAALLKAGEQAEMSLREQVDRAVVDAIELFMRRGAQAAIEWLEAAAHVRAEDSRAVFALLERTSEQPATNHEAEALRPALRAEYLA